MAENSKIEWCHHTVNFWIGCTKVSPACDFCYAERDWSMDGRHKRVTWGPHGDRSPTKDPLGQIAALARGAAQRGQRERVFVNSLSDWADNHKSILPEWRAAIFEAARRHPNLDFLLLSKRPQNIRKMLPSDWGDGYPNVWIGTTTETQAEADRRIPVLLATPAAIRFVSAEPLLGPVDLRQVHGFHNGVTPQTHDALAGYSSDTPFAFVANNLPDPFSRGHLDWVIVGGESGPGARPMHPDWARSLRDQCAAAGVPFFFKQWGEWGSYDQMTTGAVFDLPMKYRSDHKWTHPTVIVHKIGNRHTGRRLDGIEHNGMPEGR